MKLTLLPLILVLLLLPLVAVSNTTGVPSSDKEHIKVLYDSVRLHYQTDYRKSLNFLDSLQVFTLERCLIEEYLLAVKWSLQCTSDHHQLASMNAFLVMANSALVRYQSDLLPAQYDKLRIDIKAFWASYYFKLASYQKAVQAHTEVIQTLARKDSVTARDRRMIARSYQYLGNIQKLRGNYNDAIAHFWSGLDYIEDEWAEYEQRGRIAFTYRQIGECYHFLGKNKQARSYNDQALASLDKAYAVVDSTDLGARLRVKKNLIITHNSIAAFYLRTGEDDKALHYLEKSLSYHDPNDTYLKATSHLLGDVYLALDSLDQALSYYELSLKEKRKDYGEKNYANALTLAAIGRLFAKQNQHERADSCYTLAIENLTTQPDILKALEVVDWNTIYAERALINVLNYKAKSLLVLHEQKGQQTYLNEAWTSVNSAITLVEETRINYQSEEDKQFLLKDCYPLFETAMLAGYRLGPDYFEALFNIAEKSKAVLLVDQHRALNALQQASIPDSLREREQQYMTAIKLIEERIKDENSRTGSGTERIRSYYKDLVAARKNHTALFERLEREYGLQMHAPTTHQSLLKNVRRSILHKDQTIVEYFLGDEHIFILAIDRQDIHIHQAPIDQTFTESIAQLRSGLYDYFLSPSPSDSLYRHTQSLFKEQAHHLYQQLLHPVQAYLRPQLILIPDGVLGYIPFETLLTQPATGNDFARYPYLLRRHQVSYCYSAALLLTMKTQQYQSHGFLAFAPTFPRQSSSRKAPVLAMRGALDSLFYNIEEVEAIGKILGDEKLQIGPDASRSNFDRLAPFYKIIHLASHGILNDATSEQSYITFYQGETEEAKYNLLVRDLYTLRLEAELVTLSACETALGQLKRGEGIISLARGFSYAGAKSILTTLWAVNDASTTSIMSSFYRNLKRGQAKDRALHLAKINFIDSQLDNFEAHPFYWASYIAIGDMDPLYRSFPGYLWLLVLVSVFAFGYWYRNK